MGRHMKRKHPLDPQSLFFPFQDMNYGVSRFKAHKSNYYSPHSNFHNTSNIFSRPSSFLEDNLAYEKNNPSLHRRNPLDTSLEILRKIVEFKRLTVELSFTSIQQPYSTPSNGFAYQADKGHSSQPLFEIEDWEEIGYKGYICKECLIIHPLPIYGHKFRPAVKPIQATHKCNNERLLEIQRQKENKEAVVANLYMKQLPELMLRVVREWTKDQTVLMAAEVPSPFDGCQEIIISDEKQWTIRAIRDGFTVLTDDELVDFINTVKDGTFACFKMAENKVNRNSGKVFFMFIGTGRQHYS
jgi:hypothetical protein